MVVTVYAGHLSMTVSILNPNYLRKQPFFVVVTLSGHFVTIDLVLYTMYIVCLLYPYYLEIRNVGVGYYSFDVDEEKREEQIKMLNKLREEVGLSQR